MQRFPCVFLEVSSGEPDLDLASRRRNDGKGAALHHRDLVLRNLVALRQIRIEVILARKDAAPVDRPADRDSEADRPFDRALVQHGKDAG